MTERQRLGRLALRWIGRGAAALVVAGVLLLAGTGTGRYLVRAVWEEARILLRRQPIVDLAASEATDPGVRAKLAIVLEARRFAEERVELDAGDSFTTFSRLDRDTLVLVLSGSYRDRLKARTWWFPVVGRVPYKGFFDFGAARAAREGLERDGFDTHLRPAAAFSTLGWFNDPLLPTTLRQDSLDLVNTVIHELTHNTFYAPGEAVFNESFANFVGARGAAWFYRQRGDHAAADLIDRRWMDEKLMGWFWGRLHHALDSTFGAHPGDSLRDRRLALRDSIYRDARALVDTVLKPRVGTIAPARLDGLRLDNAMVLARRIYSTELELFDRVWIREGGDLPRTIRRVIAIAEDADDPFAALRAWLASAPAAEPPA